jgi:beta-phosphoglucomutase-like phosphatase (HAD superfamily)
MTQTKIRAVLFDFDGTLADSTELIMRSWRHMMRTHHGAGWGWPSSPASTARRRCEG